MPTRSNIQLARIFGIRVGVSVSWFVVLFVLIYVLSGYFHSFIGGSQSTAYAVAVAGSAVASNSKPIWSVERTFLTAI